MWTTKYRGWTSSIGCTSLKPYIHFTKGTTPSTCQLQQCNPVQISINVPTSTDANPTLGHFDGLGANIPGKDPTGFFEMCFITPPPPSPSSPSKPFSNQTAVLSVPHDETGAMRHTRLSHCQVKGPAGQPPRAIRPPASDVNFTSCLSRQGKD